MTINIEKQFKIYIDNLIRSREKITEKLIPQI